jgi:hypothetical protein|tara:strand:+ start:459 stop:848 length:390 start_codon:yes stop_codon:yes gene_type:complete
MLDSSRAVLDAWLNGVNGGEFEAVLGLYDKNAVLLPTFSNRTMASPEAISGYFEQLGTRQGLGVELHDNTVRIQQYDDHIEGIMGIYRWRFDVDQEGLSFEARFTMITDLTSTTPILHHHSSQVPRDLS